MEEYDDLDLVPDGDGIDVTGPSGSNFRVLNQAEYDYFTDVSARYLKDNHFTNITDLQDLDRVVQMELMCWRWNQWLSAEKDYFGDQIDPEKLQKAINEFAKEIRLTKKSMGIDKNTRDKDKGESVADFIDKLRIRAKEFGVMRNEQAVKAISLFMELRALITLHDNCDEVERKENHVQMSDVLDWLRNVAFPEFDEIDAKFRETTQKYYIREM